MTLKDKLEIGLKENAGKRKDNLTPDEIRGPEIPAGPGRSPEIPAARNDKNEVVRPVNPAEPEETAVERDEEHKRRDEDREEAS